MIHRPAKDAKTNNPARQNASDWQLSTYSGDIRNYPGYSCERLKRRRFKSIGFKTKTQKHNDGGGKAGPPEDESTGLTVDGENL